MSQTAKQRRHAYLADKGLMGETTDEEDKELEELEKKTSNIIIKYMPQKEQPSRHLYLSSKALMGETTDEEDKELEELEKI